MELEELRVLITAQTSGLRKELNSVKTQLGGLNTSANKSTAGISAAFSQLKMFIIALGIGKVIKDSITEGMNAVESENLFSVSLGNMANEARTWSQDLQNSLGLNGYDVRKNLGVLYTMTTSMGLTRDAAYGLSTDMTKLAYDMASFYNMSDEDAFTKIRAGLTGETEPLKALGIIVDDATIKQYAYSLGIAKSGDELTNQQKVMARYQAILAQTGNAQGDLARTIDSPANQLRLLKTNLQLLETELGRAFLPVLQVVIPIITTLVKYLTSAMTAVSQFTQSLFGSAVGTMATTINDSSISAYNGVSAQSDYADSLNATGDAAKQTAKELKGLMGFDEINKLGNSDQSDATKNTVPLNIDKSALEPTNTEANKTSTIFDGLINKAKELANTFKTGFSEGLGSDFSSSLERTKEHLSGIGSNLKEIFTDSDVQDAANRLMDKLAYNLGREIGSFVSIGQSITENIVGGFDIYLDGAKDKIKGWLVRMMDIRGEIADIDGNFSVAIADIFEVLRSDVAKHTTSDIIEVFASTFMGATEIFAKIGRDILDCITRPIIENKDAIKDAIEQTLEPIQVGADSIATFVTDAWGKINGVYDEHVKPMFDSFSSGFSDLLGKLLDGYTTYIAPALDSIATKFTEVMETSIRPAFDKFLDFIAKLSDGMKKMWEQYFSPIFNWIVENVLPIMGPIIETLGKYLMDFMGIVSEQAGALFDVLGGIIDFVVGVFTGDWAQAWEGITEIFGGIWDGLKALARRPLNAIIDMINDMLGSINSKLNITIAGQKIMDVSIPEIPHLAQGGYVRANTPQLAMIGDNTHEGEIVAPESKIAEAVAIGISSVLGNNKNVSNNDRPIELTIKIGETTIGKLAIDGINALTKMNGSSGLII